jgi:hypothetical protein
MKKLSVVQMLVVVIAAVALLLWAGSARAVEWPSFENQAKILERMAKVEDCTKTVYLRGYGASGAYGAGIMGGATLLGIALSPAGSFTLGSGAVAVLLNTVTGGAIGVGSSAVTRLMDGSYFKRDPIVTACDMQAVGKGASSLSDMWK